MTIQANQGFGVSIFGATSAGGGGSTSPGGSSGQLQYNASGSFGGMAGTSWDDTNRSLTLTGATVTTSQPVLNLSQTWNAGAVTFKGAVFNVTNTASALASRFFEIQEGGTPRFGVGIYSAGYPAVYLNNIQALAVNSSNVAQLGSSNNAASLCGYWTVDHTTGRLYSSNALYNLAFGTSVYMFGAGAGTLQLGQADAAAPVAQTLQVQSVVAGTLDTAGATFTIQGSKGTGSGAGGSIVFRTYQSGASGTAQSTTARAATMDQFGNWTFGTLAGNVTITQVGLAMSIDAALVRFGASSDLILSRPAAATLQLGAADAAAPVAQTLQVQSVVAGTTNTAGANWTLKGSRGTGTGAGGSIIFQVAPAGSSGTAQNAYATALTIASDKSATFTSGINCVAVTASSNLNIATNGAVLLMGSSSDVRLYWDAAATLALRNAGTAQTFRVYSNADGSPGSNFQRLVLSAGVTSNMAVVAADNGGTGVAMGLQFGAALTTGGGVTNIFNINTSGHLVWNTDNTYDIGASGASRPRNVYVGSGVNASTVIASTYLAINNGNTSIRKVPSADALWFNCTGNFTEQYNGTNAQESRIYGSYTAADNFQRLSIKTLRESSGALSGATYVSTIAIPAYAVLIGVTTRVTTAVTGATSYDVGDGTNADLWGAAIGVTLGSQSRTADFTDVAATGAAATSRTVTLTANGSNFTGGVVEICLHYLTTEAD